MAEGKKYIAIVELEEDSALREQWPFSGVCDDCIACPCYEDCAINKFPMTRQEAIERMAKAIKKVPKASGEVVHWQDYDKWAEASLNALLEVEK